MAAMMGLSLVSDRKPVAIAMKRSHRDGSNGTHCWRRTTATRVIRGGAQEPVF